MTRSLSCRKYFFDRVQVAGVDLFNAAILEAAKAESSRSSAYPSPAPSRILARSNEMSGMNGLALGEDLACLAVKLG